MVRLAVAIASDKCGIIRMLFRLASPTTLVFWMLFRTIWLRPSPKAILQPKFDCRGCSDQLLPQKILVYHAHRCSDCLQYSDLVPRFDGRAVALFQPVEHDPMGDRIGLCGGVWLFLHAIPRRAQVTAIPRFAASRIDRRHQAPRSIRGHSVLANNSSFSESLIRGLRFAGTSWKASRWA